MGSEMCIRDSPPVKIWEIQPWSLNTRVLLRTDRLSTNVSRKRAFRFIVQRIFYSLQRDIITLKSAYSFASVIPFQTNSRERGRELRPMVLQPTDTWGKADTWFRDLDGKMPFTAVHWESIDNFGLACVYQKAIAIYSFGLRCIYPYSSR